MCPSSRCGSVSGAFPLESSLRLLSNSCRVRVVWKAFHRYKEPSLALEYRDKETGTVELLEIALPQVR